MPHRSFFKENRIKELVHEEVFRVPYYHMVGWYPYMGLGAHLVWLIVVIVVAYLIYKLIKSEKILAPSKIPIKNAEDILAERYAKGELTREQYMQMEEDLKKVR